MTIKPLCLAQRLKRYSYIMLPLLLVGGAIGLTLESRTSRAEQADGVQTLVFLRHGEKPVGGLGEWIMHGGKIPAEEYKPYAQEFNPTQYDADAWVRLAKKAGMKYIVITTKHHDGFGLFKSKLTDWDIENTPYKKDIMAEIARASPPGDDASQRPPQIGQRAQDLA